MKTLVIMVGALLMLGGRAAAWEVKDNPDRFPSIGLHVGQQHLNGDASNTINPGPSQTLNLEETKQNVEVFGADFRLPLFKQVTFTFSYDKVRVNGGNVRRPYTFESHENLHGYNVDMGVRVYLTK